MTPKQRVRTAMARRQPDRVPSNVSFNTSTESGPIKTGGPSAQEKIMAHLGTEDYEDVLRRLGCDIRPLSPRPSQDKGDGWSEFARGARQAETVDDLHRLKWPTWDMVWDCSHLREDMQGLLDMDDEYAIVVGGPGLWELARGWRGFNQVMIDWLTTPELVTTLFEIAYQYYMPCYEVYAEKLGDLVAEVDYVYAGSDFGMQDRPMIDPELFVRDYEPFIEREVQAFKGLFPNLFFEYHCCGSVADLIPSFVRAGVEVLHPVQPGCRGMEFESLKSTWGDRLAFAGGVDAQGVMAHGTPEDVRQWVLYAFGTLGKGGGFIMSPHGLMPEVPVENVLSMFDTIQNECWY